MNTSIQLHRHPLGHLILTDAQGQTHEHVVPVRAFPLGAPNEGISLVGEHGREVGWVEQLDALPAEVRRLIEEELAVREFRPDITHILSVSSFSTPSTWSVNTDRGPTQFVLKAEEDIRRLSDGRLLIQGGQGVVYMISHRAGLDRHSRRLLERFL